MDIITINVPINFDNLFKSQVISACCLLKCVKLMRRNVTSQAKSFFVVA